MRKAIRSQLSAGMFRGYAVAVWSVAVVFALSLLLARSLRMSIVPLFLAAVMLSAWRGGLGAGLLATALSTVIKVFFFLPPVFTFEVEAEGLLQIGVFALAAIIISSLSAERERALLLEQQARREAEEANAVKDEFIAAVSHELRTPLTTIKMLTRLMLRGEQSEAERRTYLEDISGECDRQIDLVLNLLDLSRIKSGRLHFKIQAVDAREVIEEALKIERFEAEEHHQQLSARVPEDLPRVRADKNALRRTLCTIIENSIKYTPDGGSINLSAEVSNDEIHIHVADTGRGIASEDLPRIFDKFYRGRMLGASTSGGASENTGPAVDAQFVESDEPDSDAETYQDVPGIGLGLYLARHVLEQFGGRITVESTPRHGSLFTLHLAIWRDDAAERPGRVETSAVEEVERV